MSCGLTTTSPLATSPHSSPHRTPVTATATTAQAATMAHCPPPVRTTYARGPTPVVVEDDDDAMDPASEELEQRSRYLSSLIRRTKLHAAPALAPPPPTTPEPETKMELEVPERAEEEAAKASAAVSVVVEKREVKEERDGGQAGKGKEKGMDERKVLVRVRVADMPLAVQRRAVWLAYDAIASMLRLDSKRLALALKKEFDTSYGPAWHCIVGTGFGSYVTHSVGGFLYFSVDKVYILLFRTAVEPLGHPQ